ncbi:MAG: glycosyltransferase [Candidatus Paceibacterota bacterium]
MHDEFNKTILISSYAPPALGGPQNLYNLLRDTDPNSYCILTSFYNIDNLSARVGTWLKGEYIFYDSTSTTKNITDIQDNASSTIKKRDFVSKLKHFVKRFSFARSIFGVAIILSQIIAVILKGKKVIKNKGINSIIGFSDYGPAMVGSYILHKITKKRYLIFLFDIYKGNLFPFPGNLLANILEKHMFKSVDKIIVTNEGTRDFYIKRYGKDISKKIITIHNSTFPEPYLKTKEFFEAKPPYTIIFTGRIYWPQIRSIKNLMEAISEINDIEIKLKIYSPSPKDYLKKIGIFESKNIEINVTSPTEIPEIQSNADILFLPLSWHTQSQAIIDTATPGKLTDYLMAGRPILIHAPASTFLAKYAKENNFAEVVDEENSDILKKAIKKLIIDKEYSSNLIINARKTFYNNHDASVNTKIITKIINNTL